MVVNSTVHFKVLRGSDLINEVTTTNIITLNGRHDWLREGLGNRLALGTGGQVEVPEVNALENYTVSAGGTFVEVSPGTLREGRVVAETQLEVLFPLQQVPQNFTEFGIYSSDVNRLHTYSRIRNAEGDLVTVTVLPGERLQVFYRLQVSIAAIVETVLNVAGAARKVTQVVGSFQQIHNRLLPSGKVQYTSQTTDPPLPLQPLTGLQDVGSTTLQADSAKGEVLAKTQVQTVSMGNTFKMYFHLDPPIPSTEDLLLTFQYVGEIV